MGNTRVDAAPKPSPPPPLTRKEIVRKKRIKEKPQLSEEHAKSESVYYRKPGNESVVGSGTYGKVYKTRHIYTGNWVALKKIRMEGERDGFPVTAIREIKLLQSLKHVNIVALREVMVEKNDCFMVFEYLEHDLTGLINHTEFTLTPAHKKHFAKQFFEGLEHLHRRGVLHRDIKAANILISKSGDLKLGLSKYQKGLRYLQEYPATIEGDPAELGPQLQKLRISLHTNSALLQYKLKQFDDATRSANYALAIEGISDVEKAKALFRKGVVAKEQKNEEEATKFLEEAGKLAPTDAGIKNELAAVKKSAADRKAKERKAYAKMFE